MKLESKHKILTCFISFFTQSQGPPGRRKSQMQSLREFVSHKVSEELSRLASGLVSRREGWRALCCLEAIGLIIRPGVGIAEIE